MPFKRKLRPLFVFGIGLFACIASVVRLVYNLQLSIKTNPKTYQLNVDRLGLLAFAEIAIEITVGCMPSVHKLFKHISKIATEFSPRIPYSDNGGGSFWRKLLARSFSSDTSRSPKLPGSAGSGSTAPQIKTLNMTRASFTLEENDTHKLPSPAQRKERVMSKEMVQNNVMSHITPEKARDVESAIPLSPARQ